MKLLGFGHLTIFLNDKCRPPAINRVTYYEELENCSQKKKISINYQKLHNLEIYNHDYKIEIVSYPDPIDSLKCESNCSELFSELLAHKNIIYSSSFTKKFFDSFCQIFSLEMHKNTSISVPTLSKKSSIILKYSLEGQAFNSSLGSVGFNSLALYVNKIDRGLLGNMGFNPVTDTMNLKIDGISFEIVFLKLEGVLIELLRRYN